MKVLHGYKTYLPECFGGIPEAIRLLVCGMTSRVESEVLVARRRGRGRRYEYEGAPVEAVASLGELLSMPIAPAFPFVLARRARQFDVVALHLPFPLSDIASLIGLGDDTAVVVHWHSEIVKQRALVPFVAPLIRQTLARARRIIVSDMALVESSPFLRPHATKCVAIPFGVEIAYWQHLDPRQQRQADDIRASNPRLVVASGRLVTYKGFDVLVEAFAAVDGTLVVVGEGPLRAELAATAQRFGVADRVRFLGAVSRDELKTYLHAAKVFVLPSVSTAETFGIAQLEAMAVGRPIVNTALPTAVPRVARHDSEALTAAPGDPDGLARALTRLLDDSDLAARLGAAGRTRVAEEYAQTAFVARVERLYEEAAEAARDRHRGTHPA